MNTEGQGNEELQIHITCFVFHVNRDERSVEMFSVMLTWKTTKTPVVTNSRYKQSPAGFGQFAEHKRVRWSFTSLLPS